jgi:hypothetical protein
MRHYRPDYILRLNNKKILIEIKSSKNVFFDKDKQDAKMLAVLDLIKKGVYQEYWFIDEYHALAREIDFRRSNKIKPLCKKLFSEKKLILTSERHKKDYIGV